MRPTEEATVECPYCWEPIPLELDLTPGSQEYVEDCSVCCQPMVVRLRVEAGGAYTVDVERENG